MNNPIRVGILGCGTVGSSVVNLLQRESDRLLKILKRPVIVEKIGVRDLDKARGCQIDRKVLTDDLYSIVTSDEIDLVIECLGNISPAFELVEAALEHQKPVVTSNKALLAEHGISLFQLSAAKRSPIGFEASVCGGLPILKILREGMLAHQIHSLAGVLNASSNYILTQMQKNRITFDEAVKKAQSIGLPEIDTRLDISGDDAAHTLTLLARVIFQSNIQYEQIYREGIEGIDPLDFDLSDQLGYMIKAIAVAFPVSSALECRVHPALVSKDHALATVKDINKTIWFKGEHIGETVFTGLGSGGQVTASAILADIVSIFRSNALFPLMLEQQNIDLLPPSQFQSAYYVRLMVSDTAGMLAKVSGVFTEHDVSIEAMLQKPLPEDDTVVSLAFVTHVTKEYQIKEIIQNLEVLPGIIDKIVLIRCFGGTLSNG